jgi:hypothetical protein
MPTRQTICAIDPVAANLIGKAKPAATLILGTLLLLTRP